jgi:hypothetical protein
MEGLLGLPEGSRAKRCPGSGRLPVSRVWATHPNPAWHPKQPSLWPSIPPTPHQTVPRAAPEPPRSTSDSNQRYYGEAPVGLRRYERAVGGLERPPERLWRGRNRPGRRATLLFEGAWERQKRRDDSGMHRRRKVPVHESRSGVAAERRSLASRKSAALLRDATTEWRWRPLRSLAARCQ